MRPPQRRCPPPSSTTSPSPRPASRAPSSAGAIAASAGTTRSWTTTNATRWRRSGTSCRCSSRSTRSRSPSRAGPTGGPSRASPRGAERYLNRGLRPLPGYSPYPGDREANTETWFDDNGWWGLAFMNAYRATGTRRWLKDAERALAYVAAAGWDPQGGGIWWNTEHPYKAGEALAADTLLATLLYRQTHSTFALGQAEQFLLWANTLGFSSANGLYAASNLNPTPIDYIESPLIYAQALLCEATKNHGRLRTGRAADGHRAEALRPDPRLLTAVRRDLPAVDARAVLARPQPHPLRARRRQRPRSPGARAERRRALPALLERRDPAHGRRPAGEPADAGGDDQPVRVAGGLPAAAVMAWRAQTPSARRATRSNTWSGSSRFASSIAFASRPIR